MEGLFNLKMPLNKFIIWSHCMLSHVNILVLSSLYQTACGAGGWAPTVPGALRDTMQTLSPGAR